MLEPAVHRCDPSGIDTQMMRCPQQFGRPACRMPKSPCLQYRR
jgi:hypothetical protein